MYLCIVSVLKRFSKKQFIRLKIFTFFLFSNCQSIQQLSLKQFSSTKKRHKGNNLFKDFCLKTHNRLFFLHLFNLYIQKFTLQRTFR